MIDLSSAVSINDPLFFLESVCPTRIPVASRDEKGFELMVGMNIEMKAKKIPGSLVTETAFALSASTDITENTRYCSTLTKDCDQVLKNWSHFIFLCSLCVLFYCYFVIGHFFFNQGDFPRRPPSILRVRSHPASAGAFCQADIWPLAGSVKG